MPMKTTSAITKLHYPTPKLVALLRIHKLSTLNLKAREVKKEATDKN